MDPSTWTVGQVSAFPAVQPLEAGLGGLIASICLLYLLAYVNIVGAADAREPLRRTLIAVTLPLFLVFVGVVLNRSLAILNGGP